MSQALALVALGSGLGAYAFYMMDGAKGKYGGNGVYVAGASALMVGAAVGLYSGFGFLDGYSVVAQAVIAAGGSFGLSYAIGYFVKAF